MKTSESMGAIAKAVIAFESEMEAVSKGKVNPFFKSKYADLPSIIEATKPLLEKHGLGIIQGAEEGEMGLMKVQTRLIHESGEWIETELPIVPVKSDPQAALSALTYGRRGGLQAILSLSAVDDDYESGMKRPTNAPKNDLSAKNSKGQTVTKAKSIDII
jgi:hypothetical protein